VAFVGERLADDGDFLAGGSGIGEHSFHGRQTAGIHEGMSVGDRTAIAMSPPAVSIHAPPEAARREETPSMRIEVKGRNLPVTEDLREVITRRFEKVAKQVSPLAVLEVELCEERNPAIAENQVAEATLYLKGVTLRAKEASRDVKHSINLISDELARQVKRHRDKRRGRRDARAGAAAQSRPADIAEGPGEAAAAF
jgi:putative sigma-54 modulation protein